MLTIKRNILLLLALTPFWFGNGITDARAQNEIIVENLPAAEKLAPTERLQPEQTNTEMTETPLSTPQQNSRRVATLSFAWNTPVNLAAFERNGKLWLIFDHLQKIDIEGLKKTAGDLAENILQFPHPLATLIQITPADGIKYSVRKEGLLWVVDLHNDDLPQPPFREMTIFTQYDSLKHPYLFIPTEHAGNVISIIDPEIGDIISIAPSSQPYMGTSEMYRYPEFDILKTMQGLAFVINSPDIVLNRSNSGLTLRARGRGLNITGDLENLKEQQMAEKNVKAFNLQIPQKLADLKFPDAIDQLKKNIIDAKPDDKNALRIELARYYVHNGLGTEALYILNQMKHANLPEAQTDDFHSLSGIANFLARRYKEAEEDFSAGHLPDLTEGIFWRTLAQSAYQFKETNNAVIFAHISLIRDYPQEIKDQVALVATENALKTGDDLSSQSFIDILRSVPDRLRNLDPQINYLAAKKLELQGYPRNAIKEYRNLLYSDSTKYSALARYDNAVLSQRINAMPLKDAIAELEKLRYAWSEREFKLKLMEQLSKLYLKDFDYYNALRTLDESLHLVQTREQRQSINHQMVKVFEEIFLSNQADSKLSPVKALALYHDFKYLADSSNRKNEIIQRLADRLVAVDLLARATELLTELLEHKDLTPENRARIGSRLAIIRLFNNQPLLALEILDETEFPNLLPATTNPRRVIRARALSALGKTDEALALLANDYGKTALLHKFELYWNAER